MASYNKVILIGNLTKDPEVRYIPSGTAVADLSLAVNESYKNKAGEQVDSTCFVDVIAWARQAEICGEYLSKGSPILVEGRLQLDKWQNKEGETRSKLRVRAERIQFLSGPKNAEYKDGGQGKPGRKASPGAAERDEAPPSNEPDLSDMGDEDNLPF